MGIGPWGWAERGGTAGGRQTTGAILGRGLFIETSRTRRRMGNDEGDGQACHEGDERGQCAAGDAGRLR